MTDKSNTQAAVPGHGLNSEQADLLLVSSLKPEEIGGAPDLQHRRVRELLHWFTRLTQGNANPKWLRGHAFELAYYVATMGPDRSLDVDAIHKAGFLEGVNISPEDRRMLERVGSIAAQPTPEPVALPGRDDDLIRAVCLKHGYTVKEGQTDLKPYVFAAARELMQAARASLPAGFTPEQVAELVAARDKILAASLPAGGVVSCQATAVAKDALSLSEHMNDRNNALRLYVSDLSAVMLRMVTGIDHLSEVARQWEPDHSSGADRRGWVLAKDARDDAVRLLQEHAQRMDATPQPSETHGRRQMTLEQQADAFAEAPSFGFDVLAAFGAGIEAAERHHGIPASPQDGGEKA